MCASWLILVVRSPCNQKFNFKTGCFKSDCSLKIIELKKIMVNPGFLFVTIAFFLDFFPKCELLTCFPINLNQWDLNLRLPGKSSDC